MTNAPPSPDFAEQLDQRKRENAPQLLFKCARLLNRLAIHTLRERTGLAQLREAHTTLLPHIDLAGTRLTDLAARVGTSKQAVGQLVAELEEMGALEKVPDPSDGRARLIRFSADGQRGMLEGLLVLKTLEHDLAEAIGGAQQMAALHATLSLLLTDLERRNDAL